MMTSPGRRLYDPFPCCNSQFCRYFPECAHARSLVTPPSLPWTGPSPPDETWQHTVSPQAMYTHTHDHELIQSRSWKHSKGRNKLHSSFLSLTCSHTQTKLFTREAPATVYWPWAIRTCTSSALSSAAGLYRIFPSPRPSATPSTESDPDRQRSANIPLLGVHGKEEGGIRTYPLTLKPDLMLTMPHLFRSGSTTQGLVRN